MRVQLPARLRCVCEKREDEPLANNGPRARRRTYLDRSTPYFDVTLPVPSSAASSEIGVKPAACATGDALAPGLNTDGPATATLAKRQRLAAPLAARVAAGFLRMYLCLGPGCVDEARVMLESISDDFDVGTRQQHGQTDGAMRAMESTKAIKTIEAMKVIEAVKATKPTVPRAAKDAWSAARGAPFGQRRALSVGARHRAGEISMQRCRARVRVAHWMRPPIRQP